MTVFHEESIKHFKKILFSSARQYREYLVRDEVVGECVCCGCVGSHKGLPSLTNSVKTSLAPSLFQILTSGLDLSQGRRVQSRNSFLRLLNNCKLIPVEILYGLGPKLQ